MSCDLGAGAERQGCASDGAAPPLQGGVRVEELRWEMVFSKNNSYCLVKMLRQNFFRSITIGVGITGIGLYATEEKRRLDWTQLEIQ